MKVTLNIVSTANGLENEGMRNIASHIARELDSMCTVKLSSLGNPLQCVKNSVGASAVLIFARASAKTAVLARVLRIFCKKVYFILVQKPESGFYEKIVKADRISYFTICNSDAAELANMGAKVYPLSIGINRDKFRPAKNRDEVCDLRRKFGISSEKPLVIHVGHLSEGRGLEEFLRLSGDRFERLVVASGMFGNAEIEEMLRRDGVRIIKEYLPDVSEVYRMADIYLFPTKSAEFVISIPLSVTEALACGTPAVTFGGVAGLEQIGSADGSVISVGESDDLEAEIIDLLNLFKDTHTDLLTEMGSWHDSAEEILSVISK